MFWNRFYELCAKNNTKPNPVAKEIGISSGILTKWKTEGNYPNGETLLKLAAYFNCSVDYLLGLTDDIKKGSSPEKDELMKDPRIVDIINTLLEIPPEQRTRFFDLLDTQLKLFIPPEEK